MSALSALHRHRHELQTRINRVMQMPVAVLGIMMLVLLILDLINVLSPAWESRVRQAETGIWAIFVLDFLVEFALAPNKLRYLRKNWLTALSVALPAFGVLRVARAAQILRSLSLLRILATLNRGTRALGHIARRGELGYVAALTFIVSLTAAAGVYYFEHTSRGASITSPGAAIWWAVTLITTINSGYGAVTIEGRVIGFLLRLFALGVTGYLTALIAAHLLGYQDDTDLAPEDRAAIRELRAEIASLRSELAQTGPERAGGQNRNQLENPPASSTSRDAAR